MNPSSRFMSRKLAAVVVASALVLGLGACSSDSSDDSSSNTTAVSTTQATDSTDGGSTDTTASTGGGTVQAYCAAVQENQGNDDEIAGVKAVQAVAPDDIKDDIDALLAMLESPDDSDLTAAGTEAYARIAKYNADQCGIATPIN
ncbi:MAG: hypothetical protein KF906_00085 [Actinobacteria bacterium]|nr:hypothetical protein [Actinomycetota bacterium]